MSLLGSKSAILTQKALKDSIDRIFNALDHQNQGSIHVKTIDIDAIPVELLKVLKPLLIELEKYDETLDQEEFNESVMVLYSQLNVTEQNHIK